MPGDEFCNDGIVGTDTGNQVEEARMKFRFREKFHKFIDPGSSEGRHGRLAYPGRTAAGKDADNREKISQRKCGSATKDGKLRVLRGMAADQPGGVRREPRDPFTACRIHLSGYAR